MLAQQRNIDLIGNNLVNAETPGFRSERMVFTTFRHELMIRQEAFSRTFIGDADPISLVDDVVTLHQSGIYQDTGFAFDLAIDGPGYFMVQGNGTQPYVTRNGQFNMDAEGYLILPNFGRVLDQEGEPILVKNAQFKIANDGTVANEAGKRIATLAIVSPQLVDDLTRLENGMYQLRQGAEAEPSEGFRVVQGVLERSNVDYNMEMTTLLEAQRAFQSCSSALQMIDTMNRRAATSIASL
jgi:flagellar basal-body rod protein FlgG